MLTGGVRSVEVVEEMSAKERASYLARQCHGREEGVNLNKFLRLGRNNRIFLSLTDTVYAAGSLK